MNLKSRKLSEGSQRTEDAEGNMGHTVAKRFPGLGSWGGAGAGELLPMRSGYIMGAMAMF